MLRRHYRVKDGRALPCFALNAKRFSTLGNSEAIAAADTQPGASTAILSLS